MLLPQFSLQYFAAAMATKDEQYAPSGHFDKLGKSIPAKSLPTRSVSRPRAPGSASSASALKGIVFYNPSVVGGYDLLYYISQAFSMRTRCPNKLTRNRVLQAASHGANIIVVQPHVVLHDMYLFKIFAVALDIRLQFQK